MTRPKQDLGWEHGAGQPGQTVVVTLFMPTRSRQEQPRQRPGASSRQVTSGRAVHLSDVEASPRVPPLTNSHGAPRWQRCVSGRLARPVASTNENPSFAGAGRAWVPKRQWTGRQKAGSSLLTDVTGLNFSCPGSIGQCSRTHASPTHSQSISVHLSPVQSGQGRLPPSSEEVVAGPLEVKQKPNSSWHVCRRRPPFSGLFASLRAVGKLSRVQVLLERLVRNDDRHRDESRAPLPLAWVCSLNLGIRKRDKTF